MIGRRVTILTKMILCKGPYLAMVTTLSHIIACYQSWKTCGFGPFVQA